MLIAFWSAKGGAGTTVVTVAAAVRLAAVHQQRPLVVDLSGDLPHAAGIGSHDGPGVADWSRTGGAVRPDAFARLIHTVDGGFDLLPFGTGAFDVDQVPLLAQLLRSQARPVLLDAGVAGDLSNSTAAAVLRSDRSVLVTRCCFLALRRVPLLPVHPDEVVVVEEPGRSLSAADVGAALDTPVAAVVPFDPVISRAVDAGLLTRRLPRRLAGPIGALWEQSTERLAS